MSSSLKCFQVLDLLASDPYELALTEVGAILALPPASAHRIMATLVQASLAEQDPATRRYRLTGRTLWIGTGYLRRSEVYRAAFPILQELARSSRGLVHLAALDEGCVLYLHTLGSPSALYLHADTGERRPLHCTALGKAMLAFQPAETLGRLIPGKLTRFTPKTITSWPELREELARIRHCGYAVDDEENAPGLRCLAAPIVNRSGHAVAAFSMSAPAAVLTRNECDAYSTTLREAALRVSVQVGFRPGTSNLQSLVQRKPASRS
jgi:DNA-binding IclR family transcriptional regulator